MDQEQQQQTPEQATKKPSDQILDRIQKLDEQAKLLSSEGTPEHEQEEAQKTALEEIREKKEWARQGRVEKAKELYERSQEVEGPNLAEGFKTFEFIWFDLVSKMREMLGEQTRSMFQKITE